RQRHRGSDGGVDRVAAAGQHGKARLRRERVRRRHHVAAEDGWPTGGILGSEVHPKGFGWAAKMGTKEAGRVASKNFQTGSRESHVAPLIARQDRQSS